MSNASGVLTQNNAPVGTMAFVGDPANGIQVVKTGAGWRYLHNDVPVDDDAFRSGWTLVRDTSQDVADSLRRQAHRLSLPDTDARDYWLAGILEKIADDIEAGVAR